MIGHFDREFNDKFENEKWFSNWIYNYLFKSELENYGHSV